MGTSVAKRYRFRENNLWMVDTDGYYSSTATKYLTYSNPLDLGDATYPSEIHALKSALMLGVLLERVVILPKFHCCNCKTFKCYNAKHQCSLLHMLKVRSFDEVFEGKYREASFLQHNLIPEVLKKPSSTSHVQVVPQQYIAHVNSSHLESQIPTRSRRSTEKTVNPTKPQVAIFRESVAKNIMPLKEWLHRYENVPIIHFASLYFDVSRLLGVQSYDRYDMFADSVFQCTEYEQWEVKPFL